MLHFNWEGSYWGVHFGKKVLKLWKSVFFSTFVRVMTKSSREQGVELKWPRPSTPYFFHKYFEGHRKRGLKWASGVFFHNQLRNRQVPCCNCSYPENTILPVKKSKQHEKWWKNQTRSRGKHKVCLMLAPPNKEIPLKVFEKKSIKAWIQQHRLLKKKPQSNHRVELELRKAQQRNWEAPDSKLVSCFHKTWSDILNWNNP